MHTKGHKYSDPDKIEHHQETQNLNIHETKDYNRKLAEKNMLFASQDVDMKAILNERKLKLYGEYKKKKEL